VRRVVEQRKFAPIEACSYDETDGDRIGIWMSDELKRCLAGDMATSLSCGQLCFAQEFISARKPEAIQKELMEQFKVYREEIIAPAEVSVGEYRKKVTGKAPGRKDDLCVASQIALYFAAKKRLEPAFRSMAEANSWRY